MTPQHSRSASVRFIFATIFLDVMGIGIIVPVLPEVIKRFGRDPSFINHYFGYFFSIYALMQFLMSPVLGSLSDKYGRRPVLLVSLLGAGLDYILMAYAPSLSWLFIGRMISGFTGASMTVANAYMADISDDSNRSANFGMIGAAFGVGFIAGPVIGGFLGSYGAHYPFIAAAVLNIANFCFGLIVLPESLPLDKRRHLELSRLNPFKSLGKILKPSPILYLILVYALVNLTGQVHPSNWTLYTQHKFGWSSFQVGLSLSFVGLAIGLSQAFLPRILIPKLGEARSVFVGLGVFIIGYMLFALATAGWMMYAFMVFFALSGIVQPSLQSLISKHTKASQQGELQGSLVSIASLTAIVGPLMYTGAFSQAIDPHSSFYFPGIAYALASVLSLLAWIIYQSSFRRLSRPQINL